MNPRANDDARTGASAVFATSPGARAYRDALPPGELLAFPLAALDRTGIPVWKTVFFGDDGVVHHGASYGATDAQALLGAVGELSEGVHAHAALATIASRRATFRELAARYGADDVVHPLRLCLPAGSDVDADTQLRWVAGRRHPSGAEVWLPLDVVAVGFEDVPGYEPFTTPLTNGLGAGPTRDFALAHGLQELLQRDGNGVCFRALDDGVALDLSSVTDPVVRDVLARFDAAGIESIVKFASDEFGVTNVFAVGAERPGVDAPLALAITAAGEAASPERDVALRKALLEFGAARARKIFAHGSLANAARIAPAGYVERVRAHAASHAEEGRTLDAMLAWLALDQPALHAIVADPILLVRETRDASTLPNWQPPDANAPPGEALLATLSQRLAAARLEIVYVDFTTPAMAAHGVHVVKAIVPGLEVETMSYYRIGERNARKLLARESPLVARRAATGRARVRLQPEAEARVGGPLWLDVAAVDRTVGSLYALYREPDVHAAPLAREALAR